MSLLDKASLIVTPNSYKESKLYSVVPNTTLGDMDVVRATTATRVNSAGLIEVVPRNLYTYSEQFNNTDWTKLNATITADATTAPNGTSTADLLVCAGTAAGTNYVRQTKTINSNTHTLSFYAKPNANSIVRVAEAALTGQQLNYDLSNNTISGSGSQISGTITEDVNGWKKITFTYIYTSGQTSCIFNINSTSCFIWGAQLNEGTTATEYFPTTTRLNIPRIDYTNGSCPSLLVEPQRTNLLTYSEQFDDASWSKAAITVTANSIVSPSGVQNADTFTTSAYPSTSVGKNNTLSATNHTLSCYVKAGSVSTFRLDLVTAGFALGSNCIFNLSTVSTTITNYGTTTGSTATITSVGNGWYRCTLTVLTTAVVYFSQLYPAANGSVYAWGVQLEAGSYPTSYIPTIASSVTRNADVISKTGISSLIGQTEGTIFIDFYYKTPSSNINGQLAIADSSGNNRVIIWNIFSLNSLGIQLKANSTNVIDNTSLGVFVNNQRYKIAIGYKSGSTAVYVNGSLSFQNTSSFTFSSAMTDLSIGTYITEGHQLNNSTQIYKTRLTNAELAQLTTL